MGSWVEVVTIVVEMTELGKVWAPLERVGVVLIRGMSRVDLRMGLARVVEVYVREEGKGGVDYCQYVVAE